MHFYYQILTSDQKLFLCKLNVFIVEGSSSKQHWIRIALVNSYYRMGNRYGSKCLVLIVTVIAFLIFIFTNFQTIERNFEKVTLAKSVSKSDDLLNIFPQESLNISTMSDKFCIQTLYKVRKSRSGMKGLEFKSGKTSALIKQNLLFFSTISPYALMIQIRTLFLR